MPLNALQSTFASFPDNAGSGARVRSQVSSPFRPASAALMAGTTGRARISASKASMRGSGGRIQAASASPAFNSRRSRARFGGSVPVKMRKACMP